MKPGQAPQNEHVKSRARFLVIGYGNSLRRDDGVGPRVAETIAGLSLQDVKTIGCDLLTPELADPISHAEKVIFVDAALTAPRRVELSPIEAANSSQIMAHAADPRRLLAVARDVFGHVPQTWLVTIPVENLGFGEELSPMAQEGFEAAVGLISRLCREAPRPEAAGRT